MIMYEQYVYHGTLKSRADQIRADGDYKDSDKSTEWLGKGVYFFFYKYHARWWTNHSRFKGQETTILRTKLVYKDEQILDLDDPDQLGAVEKIVKTAVEDANKSHILTGVNLEESLPKKWCFACNLMKSLEPNIGIITYTFPKGLSYNYSGFSSNQRQACVSDHTIITGIEVEE